MPKYKYAIVVTGFMEVPDERAARLEAIEGIALTGKLLTTRPDLAVDVGLVEEQGDGREPAPFRRPVGPEH